MTIYLVVFMLTVSLAELAKLSESFVKSKMNKTRKLNKLWMCFFYLCIVVLLALIAAFRGIEIGTDTSNYLVFMQSNLYELRRVWQVELGFSYFIYYFNFITDNFSVFLFICHFIINFFFVFGIYRLRKHVNTALAFFLFLMFIHNTTFNIIRQYIVISFIFFFIKDLLDKRYIFFIFVVVLASFFHFSALTGLLMVIYMIVLDIKNNKVRMSLIITLVLALVVGVFNMKSILNFMIWNIGVIPLKYNTYLNYSVQEQKIVLTSIAKIVILIPYTVDFYIKRKKATLSSTQMRLYAFALLCSYTDAIILNSSLSVRFLDRLAYLFESVGTMILYPFALTGFMQTYKNKTLYRLTYLGIFGMGIGYFSYRFLYRNHAQTIPYELGVDSSLFNKALIIYFIILIIGLVAYTSYCSIFSSRKKGIKK